MFKRRFMFYIIVLFDDPIFPFDVPMSDEPPIPYPLIAKFLNKQDDT